MKRVVVLTLITFFLFSSSAFAAAHVKATPQPGPVKPTNLTILK